MSTISASPRTTERPGTLTASVYLLLLAVVLAIPAVIATMDGFDAAFVAIAATLATLKLIAAGGLWRCRRWAMFVGFGATLIDVLLCLLTLSDAPTGAETTASVVFIVIGIATLALLVLPNSRRAYV